MGDSRNRGYHLESPHDKDRKSFKVCAGVPILAIYHVTGLITILLIWVNTVSPVRGSIGRVKHPVMSSWEVT